MGPFLNQGRAFFWTYEFGLLNELKWNEKNLLKSEFSSAFRAKHVSGPKNQKQGDNTSDDTTKNRKTPFADKNADIGKVARTNIFLSLQALTGMTRNSKDKKVQLRNPDSEEGISTNTTKTPKQDPTDHQNLER